ncbi:MAG: NAD(P)H-dependent oxidoreductase subunit E, partial [Clostridium sp.]|nr:NAD(P)H-dependent oxidoreductase subunit E [Clostridium sp.]
MGEYSQGCFGCAHRESDLLERIAELTADYKGKEGSLIQVLHMAQGIYGYLPLEVQEVIAVGLDIPLA